MPVHLSRMGFLSVAQSQMVTACTQWPPDVCGRRLKPTDGMFSIASTVICQQQRPCIRVRMPRAQVPPPPRPSWEERARRPAGWFLSAAQSHMLLACTQWPPDVCFLHLFQRVLAACSLQVYWYITWKRINMRKLFLLFEKQIRNEIHIFNNYDYYRVLSRFW